MFLRPALQSDLPAIARIYCDAHFEDELSAILAPYRRDHPLSLYHFCLTGIKQRFFNSRHQIIVAVAESWDAERWDADVRAREIVGVVQWAVQGVPGALEGNEMGLPQWLEATAATWEKWYRTAFGLDKALDRANQAMITRAYVDDHSLDGYPRRVDLKGLAVAPKCQGNRIGSALIDEMKRIARGYSVVLALTSKRASYGLYVRHGFTKVGAVKFESTSVIMPTMIWEPEPEKQPGLSAS